MKIVRSVRKSRLITIFVICAIVGLLSGFIMVYISHLTPKTPPIPFRPPSSPFTHFIAAEGLIQSRQEDAAIGVPFGEIVEEIYIEVAEHVNKGDPLFKLVDDNATRDLNVAKRNLDIALAEYQKQLSLPRPEEIPPLEDIVEQRKISYEDALERFRLYEKISNPEAISLDDFNTKKFASLRAKFELEEAESRLSLLLAGAWERDLAIFKAQLVEKEAEVAAKQTTLDRYTIRAPNDGTVLQSTVRVGQYASNTLVDPLLVLGGLDLLHVQVEVNEEDVWRVIENAKAVAYVRGNSNISIPIEFVRLEPILVGKRFLTGDVRELIDTRVLRVIYKFYRHDLPVYPGEIVDVFLEAKPTIAFQE